MKVFSLRQVLVLHERMVRKYGGSSGVRDFTMLESALGRPFATFGGHDLYADIFLKAGALIQSIVKNHPFVDGNKRTAWVSAMALLKMKEWQVIAKENEVVMFMVRVANENLSVDEIAGWMKKNTRKTG